MKKLKIIIVLFISIISNVKVYALEPEITHYSNIYANELFDVENFSKQFSYVSIDGKTLYNLEPYKATEFGYIIDPTYQDNFSESDMRYFSLLYYYGYNKKNHNNIYYYMATQQLIWERITKKVIYWTTEENGKGDIIDISNYKNEIYHNAIGHYNRPSFMGQPIKGNLGETIILEDTNNMLQYYTVKNNTPNIIWNENNKLYIKIMSSKPQKIILERKYIDNDPTTFYVSSSGHAFGKFALNEELSCNLIIESNNKHSMKLKITFKDEKSKKEIKGKIKFKIKDIINNIYIENNRIFETDDNGKFLSDFYVPEGRYKIEVINVPTNYILNEGVEFEITDNLDVDIKEIDNYLDQIKEKVKNVEFKKSTLNSKVRILNNKKTNIKKETNNLLNTDNKYKKVYLFCLVFVIIGILGLINVNKKN